jgi:hypothetical protein
MGFQFDVKAKTMTATGASGIGTPRARIKGIYFVPGGSAGSISFTDGDALGTELIKLATPANTSGTGAMYVLVPNDGVRFEADPYLTLTNVTSVTFFYG